MNQFPQNLAVRLFQRENQYETMTVRHDSLGQATTDRGIE
jgi:hypothetical protein